MRFIMAARRIRAMNLRVRSLLGRRDRRQYITDLQFLVKIIGVRKLRTVADARKLQSAFILSIVV